MRRVCTAIADKSKNSQEYVTFCVPWFFVKELVKLRWFDDYRVLDQITKKKNGFRRSSDDMLSRFAEVRVFLRLVIKTVFQRICM